MATSASGPSLSATSELGEGALSSSAHAARIAEGRRSNCNCCSCMSRAVGACASPAACGAPGTCVSCGGIPLAETCPPELVMTVVWPPGPWMTCTPPSELPRAGTAWRTAVALVLCAASAIAEAKSPAQSASRFLTALPLPARIARVRSTGAARRSGSRAVRRRAHARAAGILRLLPLPRLAVLALAATAATSAALSLRGQGQPLQLLEVHARETDRGLEVLLRALGRFVVAGRIRLLREQLERLARSLDLALPLVARQTLEPHQPGRVVLRVRERGARVGDELGISRRIAGELLHQALEVAPRLRQAADHHLRLGALESQRPTFRDATFRQELQGLGERLLGAEPSALGEDVPVCFLDFRSFARERAAARGRCCSSIGGQIGLAG